MKASTNSQSTSLLCKRILDKGCGPDLPEAVIGDKTLSMKAKGLFCVLLSQYDGGPINLTILEEQSRDSMNATRHAVGELEEKGYLVRTRHKMEGTKPRAAWMKTTYFLTDKPFTSEEVDEIKRDPVAAIEAIRSGSNTTLGA